MTGTPAGKSRGPDPDKKEGTGEGVRVSRYTLARPVTPSRISTAIRWELFTRYGWMSTSW